MAFQDAWTLDTERLRGCCIHVAAPDGRMVPFCAWNLTSVDGTPLHRNGAPSSQMPSGRQAASAQHSSARARGPRLNLARRATRPAGAARPAQGDPPEPPAPAAGETR